MNRPIRPKIGIGLFVVILLLAFALLWRSSSREQAAAASEAGDSSDVAGRSRSADRPAADAERERRRHESISLAAQKWYEELLETYPRMKPVFRDVPDDQNGYLQFLHFAQSLKEPVLTDDLASMLKGNSAWDNQKFRTWLAENHDVFDKILHIAELSDQSAKGVELDRLFGAVRPASDFSLILRSSARIAFEEGDQKSALRYMKASTAFADHLMNIETPTLLGEVISSQIRDSALDSFRENFLPTLASDPVALREWKEVLFSAKTPSEEPSRVIIGEWNMMMRNAILPTLLGDPSMTFRDEKRLSINNVDGFIEAIATSYQKSADGLSDLGPDRFDETGAKFELPDAGLDSETAETFKLVVAGLRELHQGLGIQITNTAMHSAAISILLGETPLVDPVSGKPFSWDPKTRLLGSPEGVSDIDPIQVP